MTEDDRSIDGAYLGALFVCRTVTERDGSEDYGSVFNKLIVDDDSEWHEVTVVLRMYGRAPVGGWNVTVSLTYPNGARNDIFAGEIAESDLPHPVQVFYPVDIPTRMPGTYFIDATVNGKLLGRSPFQVVLENL